MFLIATCAFPCYPVRTDGLRIAWPASAVLPDRRWLRRDRDRARQFALVLMAYAEVLSRIGVLQVRRIRALRHPAGRPCVLTADAGQTADDPAQLAA
jgi:hypothetical protein